MVRNADRRYEERPRLVTGQFQGVLRKDGARLRLRGRDSLHPGATSERKSQKLHLADAKTGETRSLSGRRDSALGVLRGLRPWIQASIIAQKDHLKSVADILECAKVAESALLSKDDGSADAIKINQLIEEVRAGRKEVQQLNAKMAKMSISVTQPQSPTPERRQQRVSFQDQMGVLARRYSAAQPYPSTRGS